MVCRDDIPPAAAVETLVILDEGMRSNAGLAFVSLASDLHRGHCVHCVVHEVHCVTVHGAMRVNHVWRKGNEQGTDG